MWLSKVDGVSRTLDGGARAAVADRGLWGDGFADDGLWQLCRVSDWSEVSADEHALLFPRLLPQDGRLPPVLHAHLESRLADRRRRLQASEAALRPGGPPGAIQSAVGRILRLLGGVAPSLPTETVDRDRAIEAVLADAATGARRGTVPAWNTDREAWFAFGSSIHPAYLWPESGLSPDRGFTSAWLGHLDLGRSALMPLAVSDYLLDAVLAPRGAPDDTLAEQVRRVSDPADLRRAAERRAAGGRPVVSPRKRSRRTAIPGAMTRALAFVEAAVERA